MAAKPQAAQAGSTLDRLPVVGKVGLGALFLVLFAALYFVVFYDDVSSAISSAKQQQSQLEDQLRKSEDSKAEYQKDLEEKTKREQLAREQKKILPDDAETPAFLAAIQGVATISGVNLTSWSPVEQVPMEFYAKVPMKLTLTGKFHQVAKFFHGVGQLDRIINVEDIHIKTPKKQGDDIEVDVECLATAFRAVTQAESTAATRHRGAGH